MLSSVVVEEEKVLSHITGKWMSPFALRETLKRAGVNIFPAEYSPEYVPVPRKAALTEVKAYDQMALMAAAFAFAHSKWNGEAGPERVVFKVCGVSPALTPAPGRQRINSPGVAPAPASVQSQTAHERALRGHGSQQQDTCQGKWN
ncbi:PREDICTED: protein CASC1-like [Ficedula albicollis]|uniref:protein CASC1-like n=1 Tax=Ficedula albicollis TaxID=59894 RepID=UPI00035A1196|nr:PREDICTED: protein CASC1-like [Ficedula albicollis]